MSTPILARHVVGRILLRDGEQAITITGGPHRVIVRHAHLSALLDDLSEHEEGLNA